MKIKRMHFGLTASIMLFVALCLIATPAFSQGNIHFGRLKVSPSVSYKGEFDDNIYSEANNEVDDYISTVTPGVDFSYKGNTEGNHLKFGYKADIVFFEDQTDNNYQGQKPYVELAFKTPGGFYLKASDRLVSTEDRAGSQNKYNLGRFTSRLFNTARILAGYAFMDQYAIEVFYKNHMEDFEEAFDDWQDLKQGQVGVNLVYNYSPKTSLFFQYRYTDSTFEGQEDGINMALFGGAGIWNANNAQNNEKNEYFVGARFKPGGKLSGEAKFGLGDQEFENAADKDGLAYDDNNTWVAETNVTYNVSQRTGLTLNVQRALRTSTDSGSIAFYDTTLGLRLKQQFANRIKMNLGISWNNEDYKDLAAGLPNKEFDTMKYNIGFSYQPKQWFTASIGLDFEDKEATNNAYRNDEYDKTVFWFKLAAAF